MEGNVQVHKCYIILNSPRSDSGKFFFKNIPFIIYALPSITSHISNSQENVKTVRRILGRKKKKGRDWKDRVSRFSSLTGQSKIHCYDSVAVLATSRSSKVGCPVFFSKQTHTDTSPCILLLTPNIHTLHSRIYIRTEVHTRVYTHAFTVASYGRVIRHITGR